MADPNFKYNPVDFSARDLEDFFELTGFEIEQMSIDLDEMPMRQRISCMAAAYYLAMRKQDAEYTFEMARELPFPILAAAMAPDELPPLPNRAVRRSRTSAKPRRAGARKDS